MSAQLGLFANKEEPGGLRYQPDFVSVDEEGDLISICESCR